MKIVWTLQAIRDLVEARDYVEQDNPKAAADLSRRILRAIARLARQPQVGRRGRLAGTRELIVARTSYVIPYRVLGGRIELLRVLHGARRYPSGGDSP